MKIVGELINSTRKSISEAIERKDTHFIQDLARRQAEAGADFIDLNAAASSDEMANIQWLAEIVQQVVDVPLCLDSPSADALRAGLQRCRTKVLVNSILELSNLVDSLNS